MKRILSGWKYALIVVGLAILVMLVIDFNDRLTEWRELLADHEEIKANYDNLAQTQAAYQTQIAYATSEGAVRDYAYGDGHMAREGDVLVVPFSEGGTTPEPVITAPAPTEVPPNWQLWLALFVDPVNP